jgi:hypothetical protein
LTCSCYKPLNPHDDPRHITLQDLSGAADAAGITVEQAAANLMATLAATESVAPVEVVKADAEPQRFVLGIAYQSGPDPRIAKGQDGGRDYFDEAELEKACWSYLRSGCPQIGIGHADGSTGAAVPVESYIYRNPAPWVVSDDLVVKKGDWVLGAILSEQSWKAQQDGRLSGWSPQGVARRRRVARPGT